MSSHTTDSVCALTGASLSNLRRWQRHGLVSTLPGESHWTDSQLSQIRDTMLATAYGATAREISFSRVRIEPVKSFGWLARRGELLSQLESGSGRQAARVLRNQSHEFSGDDFINKLMKPLGKWLRADERTGSARRLTRFNHLIKHHALAVGRRSHRQFSMPLLLEVSPDADETGVLLEVIRLTGQGFCVDVFTTASGPVSASVIRCYDHHLLWRSEGGVQVKPLPDESAAHEPVIRNHDSEAV